MNMWFCEHHDGLFTVVSGAKVVVLWVVTDWVVCSNVSDCSDCSDWSIVCSDCSDWSDCWDCWDCSDWSGVCSDCSDCSDCFGGGIYSYPDVEVGVLVWVTDWADSVT